MHATICHYFFGDFYHSFYYSALIIATLTGIACLAFSGRGFKTLIVLLIITFISEVASKVVAVDRDFSNNVIYHIFTPVEFLLYATIYIHFLNSYKWKKILAASVVFMILFEVVNSFFLQGLNQTNTNSIILESILLIFLSLRLFLKLGESAVFENIIKSGVFWFNGAVLIYYSFNIMVWGFHSIKVYQMKNPPTIMYDLLLLMSGLLYITFAISILLQLFNRQNKLQHE